jgi:metallophosphoesterase (TIGR00282 family)
MRFWQTTGGSTRLAPHTSPVMLKHVNVLFIGDIFAKPGLTVTSQYLKQHKNNYDFIIANGENTAGGFGITRKHFEQLLDMGIDAVTLGNHTWDQQEAMQLLEETPKLIRPLNYPPGTPGLGFASFTARTGERIHVMQAMGRIFMDALDCPFRGVDAVLETLPKNEAIILDFHAEATSEKKVMFYHTTGRVSAVIGTHTHVQTADETVKQGTAFITDVGMTGAQDSSIGMSYEEVHRRFVQKLPSRYKPADKPGTLCALALEIETGKTRHVERIWWNAESVPSAE